MSRREDIDTSIWSDPDFLDLSPVARSVYIWTFTNHRCGMAGIYKVPRQAIALETGWDGDILDDALTELASRNFAFYDGRVIFVRSRVKHLRTKSPSIAAAIGKDLASIGEHEYVDLWRAENGSNTWILDTPSTPPPGTPTRDPIDTPPTPPEYPLEGVQGKGKGKGIEVGGVGEGEPPARLDEAKQTQRLVDYWRQRCHPDAKPTDDRKAKVRARLREGYTPDQIRQAIDGAATAAFVDERGHRHDDLTLICRTGSKLEDFIRRGQTARRDDDFLRSA